MGKTMEIERKFLLEKIPEGMDRYENKEIRQYYISTDPTIRIRQYGESYFLTVKGQGALIREEFEMSITKPQFEKLMVKKEPGEILKTRYRMPLENDLSAEIDIYHGALKGLLILEVEFGSVEEAHNFKVLSWFGREVTGDRRYSNSTLFSYGME